MTLQPLHPVAPALPSSDEVAHSHVPARWLRHLGLLNDYVRIPYANGSSFASQFLYREFRARGHRVTVVGPTDPDARPDEMPERYLTLRSLPLRNHPGVRLPLPSRSALARIAEANFDLVLGQTSSEFTDLGVWLRATRGVPFVSVNTLHLASAYNAVLPDVLAGSRLVRGVFDHGVVPAVERHAAGVYNHTDGLIVLSRGLADFWSERGVEAPIHVIPRAVDPKVFEAPASDDPFSPRAVRGQRLLVVCRHAREKEVDRILRIFARHVVPCAPEASLTLVGDGPEHDTLRALARKLGIAERTHFVGEFPLTDIARFYRHADLFVYASRSETYGQVVSEALWCGLPVIAFADGMGVSDQVEHDLTGMLVDVQNARIGDEVFGAAVLRLLRDPSARRVMGETARVRTRARVHPSVVMRRYYEVFESARAHCERTRPVRGAAQIAAASALARWASVQSMAIALGLLRRPANLNRHGRRQPGWSALEPGLPANDAPAAAE
ncbi:MAG: glycosyltransferase [Polyangiales bacterium]